MEIKELFGEESIDFETFNNRALENGLKVVDLSTGAYVSKDKYDKLQAEYEKYKAENDVSAYADYETLKTENEMLKAEKTQNERYAQIANAGVEKKFSKFVLSEVEPLVTEEKDFEACLKEYVEANPQFKSAGETKPSAEGNPFTVVVSSGANLEGGTSGGATGTEAVYDELNKIMNKGE